MGSAADSKTQKRRSPPAQSERANNSTDLLRAGNQQIVCIPTASLRRLIMAKTKLHNTSCACVTARSDPGPIAIVNLESIRDDCPALHSLFLPDDTWPEFKAWHAQPDEVALHRSMLLLA